ncbi:MAG: hypothetical protein LBJ91_02385, partial [Clostridiales Family XIII bacterium]|nr:hypothetical protein [Clostridiales Family XIII bacterium]
MALLSGTALGACELTSKTEDNAKPAAKVTKFESFAEGLDYKEAHNWYSMSENPGAPIDVFVIYPTVVIDPYESTYVVDTDSPKMTSGVEAFVRDSISPILDG